MLQNAWLFQILYVPADIKSKSSVLTQLKLWTRGGIRRDLLGSGVSVAAGLSQPEEEEMREERRWRESPARKAVTRPKAAAHSYKRRFKSKWVVYKGA